MTERKINRGSEIRTKGKSMGRERSGASADPSDRPSPQAGGLKTASSAEDVRGTQDGLPPSTESAEGSPAALAERSLTLRAALFLTGRIVLMLAGIAVMGLGIDIVVKADLGNSPISATPNVLSLGFTAVSFGTFMLGWQCFLVLVQIALLRREFRLVDLWQIPISVFFGVCIDAFMTLLGPAAPTSYVASWLWLIGGMAVLALGIVMTVVSGTVMNCGEAVVQAVVRKTGARFGTVKVGFDLAWRGPGVPVRVPVRGSFGWRARGHLRLRRLHRRHRERLHGPLRASCATPPADGAKGRRGLSPTSRRAPPQQKRRRRQGRKKRHCRPIVQQGDVSGQE